MACVLTQGYQIPCMDGVGGIKEFYVTEIANKSTYTETSGVVTAFTLQSTKKFWTYALPEEYATMSEEASANYANGTIFYKQSFEAQIRKLSASTRNELKLLAQNRVYIIVLDRNGTYWLLGATNGLHMVPSTSTTGKAFGDFGGYTLKWEGMEADPMVQVTGSLMATLTVAA
jgi:hypothetical protein